MVWLVALAKPEAQMYLLAAIRLACPLHDFIQTLKTETGMKSYIRPNILSLLF